MNQEQYIEHEVQLRLHAEYFKELKQAIYHVESKLDNQFKWTIGTIVVLFLGVLPFLLR